MKRFLGSIPMRVAALCVVLAAIIGPLGFADDWPQWRGPNRDAVWNETGIIESFSGPQIPHVWEAEISNGYCGPTVADGRVFVMDRVVEPKEIERVLCFDAATGAKLWAYEYESVYRVGYPDGPRASVTIEDGRAYALGTMGHVTCFDAKSGEVLWKKEPDKDYEIRRPAWGMTSAPLVEGEVVIVQIGARPDGCLIAWDRKTGEERWRALEDPVSYSAPIVVERAGQRILICWTGANIAGLNPATGEVYWTSETPPETGVINIATPVVVGDQLFISSFYDGSYMFRLAADGKSVETVWRRLGKNERQTDALHALNGTPMVVGDYVYGADSYGEFRCLDGKTGDRLWEDLTVVPKDRWATVHMVRNGDRVWMFNSQGELIIAELSPKGYHEISRAKLIEPTEGQYAGSFSRVKRSTDSGGAPAMFSRETGVAWSHPAYANKHVFIRNDTHLVCADLGAK